MVQLFRPSTRVALAASVLAAAALSCALAWLSFVFRGTALLSWSEIRQSLPYQTVLAPDGYGWQGSNFEGFGWTEVEQNAISPADNYVSYGSDSERAAPYWASMSELPLPKDDERLCANCSLTRVDGAFGWPFRMLRFRAESAWSFNPNGPNGAHEPSYTLEPLIGSTTFGMISPISKRASYSGDQLVPGGLLWRGFVANVALFTAVFWMPPLLLRAYRRARTKRRLRRGVCHRCEYDVAKQQDGSTCPECGATVIGSTLRMMAAHDRK